MARKRTDWLQFGSGKSYFHRVHRPLQCLVFITPLLLFYQIGTVLHPFVPAGGAERGTWHVVAFILMLRFFAFFGAAGNVLPLLAVVAILIFWHLARKDPWDFEPRLYAGMAAESVIWGVPFVVIAMAVMRHAAAAAAGSASSPSAWQQVVISVGAGVYEELIFRLIAINLLSMVLMDAFEMKPSAAIPIIILTSAILFSAYHYLGDEGRKPFDAGVFAFRAAMGVYLAGIYVYRGFGIVVGAHTIYDLTVVAFMYA